MTQGKRWIEKLYLATALDPIHIGVGGYRLGRVDLTICREPVTNIPKIPGTTMSGAIKFFADMALIDMGLKDHWCASTKGSENEHKREFCPTCTAFGYTPQEGGDHDSRQGILSLGDAMLFLFPVRTMLGPVWITCPSQFERLADQRVDFSEDAFALPKSSELQNQVESNNNKLNIGWLYLEKREKEMQAVDDFIELYKEQIGESVAERAVLLSDRLFEHVVNDQLEVRTSVVIDPETGASKTGGLFTYEAVPRGAVFITRIIANDYAHAWEKVKENNNRTPDDAFALVEKSFPGLDAVGLGGMTTRGFGRLRMKEVDSNA